MFLQKGLQGELRKRLSQCFSTNVLADETVVNSLDVETELEECEAKFSDLSSLVADYVGNYKDNEFQRLTARLWHLYYRVERIPTSASVDVEFEQRKGDLLKNTKVQLDSFTDKDLGDRTTAASGLLEPSTLEEKTTNLPKTLGIKETTKASDLMSFTDVQTLPNLSRTTTVKAVTDQHKLSAVPLQNKNTFQEFSSNVPRSQSIPVYKWGIKFDNSQGQSIGAFLERVEELRRARGVTHCELFDSAVDLFAGSALIWYRSTLSRISSWDELCKEMRIVFQAPDYDFRLQQEIFSRVQGDNEHIDMFIAAMEGLYNRLASSVPESTRLKQIMHNLHPQLQDRLALFEINTLEDLRHLGRKAEAGRLRSLTRPTSYQNHTLEPDLAYAENHRRRSQPVGRVASTQVKHFDSRSTVNCWNCGEPGHRFSLCRKERKRFCFGCGAPDTLKTNCSKCGPKNGLGREPATGK